MCLSLCEKKREVAAITDADAAFVLRRNESETSVVDVGR